MEEDIKLKENNVLPTKEEDVSFGPLIGIIIIVALLAIGALYFFKKADLPNKSAVKGSMIKDAVINELSRQNSSDEIGAIKKDLSATSIEALNRGLLPLSNIK